MKSLDVLRTFQAHQEGTTSVAFSPDGTLLASGGYDSQVRLWDVGAGKQNQVLTGHRRGLVAFSPDGGLLASGGLHPDTIIYSTVSWEKQHLLKNTASTWALTFTPDGQWLAVVEPERPLQMWDTQTWQLAEEVETGDPYVYALEFAPGNDRVALAVSERGFVKVLDRSLTQEVVAFVAHHPVTFGMAFAPDGMLLATVGADSAMRLWNTTDWRKEGEIGYSSPLLCVAFAPDRHLIAMGSLDGTISLCLLDA